MPDTYRVIYTRQAANQLEDVFEYIANDSPQNAAGMIRRLLEAIESLHALPHRYPLIEKNAALAGPIRSMPVRPYLVRYLIDESKATVTIVSIRHGARRPEM